MVGAGNANSLSEYKQVDVKPYQGNNYYRLKIVSFAGAVEYSDLRHVRFSQHEVAIYPNPVRDQIFLAFNTAIDSAVDYEIHSIFGQLLTSGTIREGASIDLSGLDMALHPTIGVGFSG